MGSLLTRGLEGLRAAADREAAARSIAIGAILEVRLENRLQHNLGGGLNHPVAEEVKDAGVRLNAVLPTIIDTLRNRTDMPRANSRAG